MAQSTCQPNGLELPAKARTKLHDDNELVLVQLPKQQKELKVKTMRCQETISPIQQAPEDILHHIFGICLSDNEFTVDDTHHPSVVLSHVCKSWRTLILSHPVYWSNICITTPYAPLLLYHYEAILIERQDDLTQWTAKLGQISSAARAFINRSGECPLTITLHMRLCIHNLRMYSDAHHRALDIHRGILQTLCSVSSRWTQCDFDLPTCECVDPALEPILKLKAADVPLLTRLQWHRRVPSEEGGIHLGSSLQSLSILQSDRMQPWCNISVNWSTLTELCYNGFLWLSGDSQDDTDVLYFGVQSALALLKCCTSLVTCALTIYADVSHMGNPPQDYPQDDSKSRIELNHLRSLTISGYLPAGEFSDALCIPSLRELHLVDTVTSTHNSLWSWMNNFGQDLTALSLVLDDIAPEDIAKLLASVPNLRSLEVTIEPEYHDEKSMGKALLDALTYQFAAGGELTKMFLCPNLRQFSCFQDSDAFSEADLVPFLKARRTPAPKSPLKNLIEYLEVEFARSESVDLRGLLLEEGVDVEGLTMQFRYEKPPQLRRTA